MKLITTVFVASAILVAQCAAAQEPRGNLVTTRWLEKNLGQADVLLLDASPRPLHTKAHIPGAVPVDVMAVAMFGVRDVPVAQVEKVFQSFGVDASKRVIIYDQGGAWFAPRLFFALQYHGFPAKNIYLLDGGMAKWQADKLPVTAEATPAPKPGTFRVGKINEEERSRPEELVAASGDRASKVLLDALGPEYYYGATQFFNKAGHIPGAVLLPAEDFFNTDKTFKSPEEMRRMAALFSIRPDQEVHAHCGGGGAAAVPYFALKYVAGLPKVKLSVESQMGWLQDERDLPFWTYGAPGMMREAEWVGSWGGKMMRMYGVSRMSVVDVRSPEAYAQGHLPFAVNVPAATFANHAGDPRKLAELLGAAGVDSSHEAVVVSGAGITKDSALAYVALEKLGQRKVSVLLDSLDSVESLDKMARIGFGVTKEPTIVGKPSKPTDMAVAPATYAVNARPGIAPSANDSPYPRVYIASGAAVPAKTPGGKVIHVPYTQLIAANGAPKPAKDIWTILSKAGVPRYAELVTFSDDPGEAAVNYFILKLMGYPEARVLAL